MSNSFAAHAHTGNAWVPGVLTVDTQISEPRLKFKANLPELLPAGPRIRTRGFIDGIIYKAVAGSDVDNRNYRPSQSQRVLLISTTKEREGLEPHLWVFAVDDPSAVVAVVKAHREEQ